MFFSTVYSLFFYSFFVVFVVLVACAINCRKHNDILKDEYMQTVEKIQDLCLNQAWFAGESQLTHICDYFGARMSGSQALNEATDYVATQLGFEEYDAVVKEGGFTVPRWIRGDDEYVELLTPVYRRLHSVALGFTLAGEVEGELVIVSDWDELHMRGNAGEFIGKIVLINALFTQTYSDISSYRVLGPKYVSGYGGIGCLVRSITPYSLQSPHTGITLFDANDDYDDLAAFPIPASALTLEDADLLSRFVDRSRNSDSNNLTVTVGIKNSGYFEDEVNGYNILAEVKGSTLPKEIVIIAGHIDTWDNTVGYMDDGGGFVAAWHALKAINELVLSNEIPRPQRTIRFVAYTNEESLQRGGNAYRDKHVNEIENHVFALESDDGNFHPLGISFTGEEEAYDILVDIGATYLERINASNVLRGGYGADIWPLMQCGVPGGNIVDECVANECSGLNATYFYYHHTNADTPSINTGSELQRLSALMATYAYIIADMPTTLARPELSSRSECQKKSNDDNNNFDETVVISVTVTLFVLIAFGIGGYFWWKKRISANGYKFINNNKTLSTTNDDY